MWLDDCRIPFTEDGGWGKRHNQEYPEWKGGKSFTHGEQHLQQNDKGRFTPNLLVCDDMLNNGVITKQSKRTYKADMDIKETSLLGFGDIKEKIQQGDTGSSSRYYDLDKWFDKVIDEIR